uniref:hypothetical protein n=1 Tax=Pseudanabaena sp. UWO311 TaxID=2487337 RepID=UPI001CC20AE0
MSCSYFKKIILQEREVITIMFEISGYKINTLIYESDLSSVYRGNRSHDFQPVILKILKLEYPTAEAIARYKLEYEICNRLREIEGVVKA